MGEYENPTSSEEAMDKVKLFKCSRNSRVDVTCGFVTTSIPHLRLCFALFEVAGWMLLDIR